MKHLLRKKLVAGRDNVPHRKSTSLKSLLKLITDALVQKKRHTQAYKQKLKLLEPRERAPMFFNRRMIISCDCTLLLHQ